ncbi:MAG: oligosaccharide flippase family protein, partial [Gammaproteobacteria bacterium]|nr:oligosaccharide flippase family protein [Gammaproteobacteria bacterium]
LQKAKIASLLSVAKRYRRFPIFTGSATLINVLNMQSVTIFLAFLYEPRVVGLFGLATRLLGIPVTLIAMSISQVLFMKIVGLIKTDAKMLPKVFLEMTRILTFISFPVLCLFMFLGTGLVGLIFGKEWGEASLYLRVMVVMSFFQIVAEPLGPVLIALEKQRLHFLREVFHMILILLVFGAAYIFKFKVMFFLSVFVGAEVFYYVLHLLISWMAIKVYLKETLPQE